MTGVSPAGGPLAGVRVLELGHALAGPFASVLLGDFGADVIKIEKPGNGDSLRAMGPQRGDSGIWWRVTGRNKRSVCIDLQVPEGRQLVRDLAAESDVLIENFRPGVLERLGLGYDGLASINPGLVMLRVSGFGQTGPYRERGGFGKVAEAFSGATHLTGATDAPPVHPGYSLGDATTGLMGAFGIMVALHHRRETGRGQEVDLALYEPLLRMIEWQVPLYDLEREAPMRNGPRFPFDGAFITDICRTKDEEAVVVSAATTDSIAALRRLMVEVGTLPDGATSEADLVFALRDWTATQTRETAIEALHAAGVVAGKIYSAADIVEDPHIAARANVVEVPDGDGTIRMPGVIPRLVGTPGAVKWVGPRLGQHTDEVLTSVLGIDQPTIDRFRAAGTVA